MPVLTMDEISAKTLPVLDGLTKEDGHKYLELLEKTDGAALDRLVLAAISRINHLGYIQASQNVAVNLVEDFVRSNLLTTIDKDEVLDEMNTVLSMLHPAVKRGMLTAAILRYTMFQNG